MAFRLAASVAAMNSAAIALLAMAGVAAAANWFAVTTARRQLEWITKPLVMLLLIGAALAIDTAIPGVRTWFVLALVASLAGDVFLMLEPDRFIAGLSSFLVAHVAYIVGFGVAGMEPAPAVVVAGVALVAVATIGKRIHAGARARDAALAAPVAAYIAVISAFLVAAVGSTTAIAAFGAVFFYTSDTILGWNKFVAHLPNARISTMSTYHVAQALLVISLVAL